MSNKQPVQKLTNPVGRPKGSKNKRTLIREALQEIYPDGEQGFWLSVAAMAKEGDIQAMAMLADRLAPKLRPQAPRITLPEPLTGSLADMARQIVQHAGSGDLNTTQATELLSALANAGKVIEVSELEERLNKLEQVLDK